MQNSKIKIVRRYYIILVIFASCISASFGAEYQLSHAIYGELENSLHSVCTIDTFRYTEGDEVKCRIIDEAKWLIHFLEKSDAIGRINIIPNKDTVFIIHYQVDGYQALIWNRTKCVTVNSSYNYDDYTDPILNVETIPLQSKSGMMKIIESWDTAFIQSLRPREHVYSDDIYTRYVQRIIIKNHRLKRIDITSFQPLIDWEEAEQRFYGRKLTDSLPTDNSVDVHIERIQQHNLCLPDSTPTSVIKGKNDFKKTENDNFSKWPLIVIAIITTLIAASLIFYRKRKK